MAPPPMGHLSPVDRVRLWAQMVDEGDRLLYDTFLRTHGDEAAARAALGAWLQRRDADATAAKLRILSGRPPSRQPHGG
jgi:hypothetical protein